MIVSRLIFLIFDCFDCFCFVVSDSHDQMFAQNLNARLHVFLGGLEFVVVVHALHAFPDFIGLENVLVFLESLFSQVVILLVVQTQRFVLFVRLLHGLDL